MTGVLTTQFRLLVHSCVTKVRIVAYEHATASNGANSICEHTYMQNSIYLMQLEQ